MNTKNNINFRDVLHQLKVAVFCITREGDVIDSEGDTSILSKFCNDVETNLFSLFPSHQNKKIQSFISDLFLTKTKKTFCLSFNDKGKEIIFKVVMWQHAEFKEYVYISFSEKPSQHSVANNEERYESYKEIIRKLEISETKYSSFFENDPVMHISFDLKTNNIIECNNLVVTKLGLSTKDDLIGKPLISIFKSNKNGNVQSLFEKFNLEGSLKNEEIDVITAKKNCIPSILYATIQRDKCGNVLVGRFTLVDISELKKIQKTLQRKRAYLELLNNQLEQFVYTCSHDLQEPLATIKFAGDIIGKLYGNKLDSKGRSYLKYIDEAVDRLTEQIKMLLSHAKIGDGKDKVPVNLNEVLSYAIEDLGKRIKESKAIISIPQNLPTIKGYKTELRLLFQNLISNAIKYKKEISIPQIIVQANDFEDSIEFLISDNGIGIAAEDRKEVFKIFNKVNQNSPQKGAAIGLAHCEKIVQMHSGKIYVKSAINSGSTFVFTLKK